MYSANPHGSRVLGAATGFVVGVLFGLLMWIAGALVVLGVIALVTE